MGEECISDRAKEGLVGRILGEISRKIESPSLAEEAQRRSGVCPS